MAVKKTKNINNPLILFLSKNSEPLFSKKNKALLSDPMDDNMLIEQNFAGTFIGDLSQFKFHIKPLNYCQIKSEFLNGTPRYGI